MPPHLAAGVVRAVEVAAAGMLGLLTGAMVFIGAALVPYWFSLDPPAFAAWFARNSPYVGGVMVPLGGLSTLFSVAAAGVAWRVGSRARAHFALAAAMAVLILIIYLVEHASLNARLASGALAASEVEAALHSWRRWHWARVTAGAIGYLAALLGLARGSGAE